MKTRILILGAGFGGLELSTVLSEALGDSIEVTLIDGSDGFIFGFAKLDLMSGRSTEAAIRHPYAAFAKPGVKLLRETITAIDPVTRRVTTNNGAHDADIIVVALGADYDVSGTPGVVLGKNEFYSVAGAAHLATVLPGFRGGHAIVGVCGVPYKCPPAPSECALMLHDHLVSLGVREASTITLVNPLGSPVPPSPETSKALLEAFAERGIVFMGSTRVTAVDEAARTVSLDTGNTLPCDLFLGVPKNKAACDPRTLTTKWPDVYAVGDLAATGAPKAGVFAEGAAKAVAANIISRLRNEEETAKNPGFGSCYIEFGSERIAKVDVDFFSGPKPTGTFYGVSEELRADKKLFGSSRLERWFGK
jgi:sulfide:quinone oxidoreductase